MTLFAHPAAARNLRTPAPALAIALAFASGAVAAEPAVSPLAEVLAAGRDVWGELAMSQPNGASYEFFATLLPPPRYVHADFRHYPLVLSAPSARTKARLISNGSGVNLRGGSRSWKEIGQPVIFRVGPDEFLFGGLPDRLAEPQLAEGWLPIYEITYRHPYPVQSEGLVPIDQQPTTREAEVYRLEAFATTDPALAEHAVVLVRFSLAAGARGLVSATFDPPGAGQHVGGELRDASGQVWAVLGQGWKWERQGVRAALAPGQSATLAIATRPLAPGQFAMNPDTFVQHRTLAAATWKATIDRALRIELPEERLNQAWKNLLVQNFMLASGDRMFYSAGNQYEQLYEAEGSDAVLAMLAYGYEAEAREMFVPLLDFTRRGLEHHQAALKLNNVIRYWWQTRDAAWVRQMQPRWEKELSRLIDHRSGPERLLPKERYCGDISTPVHSLSVEAKAWRAVHDLVPVLRALGESELAERVAGHDRQLRPHLTNIVLRSVHRETSPPFVPIALLDRESVHSPITATRIGSYWNLMIQYALGSRLFPPGAPEEAWIPEYLEAHGGLCLGMIRTGGTAHAFWTGPDRVNPLYGTRYVVDCLRRDEPERALVSFYGMLAQGFTRNTLVAGEGTTLAPVDPGGRFFYCPPNSAGNAHFLTMLRNLLVQDFDLDDDGQPETLRLLFATSRRWLDDGRRIVVERAPTAFGPVSVRMESRLAAGEVLATVDLPARDPPPRVLLRARLPAGWRVTGAVVGAKNVAVDERGTVDLSGARGRSEVRFTTTKAPEGP